MGAAEFFVYVVVFPACVILAYKRIPFADLRVNAMIWAIPFAAGEYALIRDQQQGLGLLLMIAMVLALYAAAVTAGAWMESRLAGRRER